VNLSTYGAVHLQNSGCVAQLPRQIVCFFFFFFLAGGGDFTFYDIALYNKPHHHKGLVNPRFYQPLQYILDSFVV
jgi:hypothetical protein